MKNIDYSNIFTDQTIAIILYKEILDKLSL